MENLNNNNKMYSFDYPFIQAFSIPSNIVFYISKNPNSPKCLLKLQKTCKWFFGKNKIIVIKNGYFEEERWPKFQFRRKIDEIYRLKAKIWYCGHLEIVSYDDNLKNEIVEMSLKIFRNDLQSLAINCSTFTIHEFELLTSSYQLQKLVLFRCFILDDEMNDIELDRLFERMPKVARFLFTRLGTATPKLITNKMLENLIHILEAESIADFAISGFILSPTLDPNLFSTLIKKCSRPNASFRFYLNYGFYGQQDEIEAAINQTRAMKNGPREILFMSSL